MIFCVFLGGMISAQAAGGNGQEGFNFQNNENVYAYGDSVYLISEVGHCFSFLAADMRHEHIQLNGA